MSLLPSPIPHPLDYCPWDLPGWVYEALDWVVGVEWPEGDERAVWDLADQWYAVAGVLAGPRDDAVAAAAEVRSGYGGIGAVAEAFDTAWRRVAEGDEAPLPVLIAVSGDLGRLVEECGCDIEGAKLEVWIELGILVVELLALAVAAVLTAGAASPAAAAAITATRVVVQQIFKRLLAQLARKALKQGLKEAGERAAKEVAKGGARGLARRAVKGGLLEAGEEAGVSLATQAYQNSTGRRHGLDLADVGTSALGGLAGGAVAPLAGLGRHATGRGAKVGEHLGREMAGETLAETAAGLATGQGLTSLEDTARAAVSGASGSATGQVDAALHARLEGRLHSLAGAPLTRTDFPVPPPPPVMDAGDGSRAYPGPVPTQVADGPPAHTGSEFDGGTSARVGAGAPTDARVALGETLSTAAAVDPAPARHSDGATAVAAGTAPIGAGADESPVLSSVTADPALTVSAGTDPVRTAANPTLSSVTVEHPPALSPQSADPSPTPVQPTPGTAGGTVASIGNTVTTAGAPAVVSPSTSGPATAPITGTNPSGHASPVTVSHGPAPVAAPAPTHQSGTPTQTGSPPEQRTGAPQRGADGSSPPRPNRFPLLETLAPGPATSPGNGGQPPVPPSPSPDIGSLRPRTPEWYAAKAAAEREGIERRRYQGYFEAQRAWYEDRRRRETAGNLQDSANYCLDRARWFKVRAREVLKAGLTLRADHLFKASQTAELDSYELSDTADAVQAGTIVPDEVLVDDPADFRRINDDVADLALGCVETTDRSALTGNDDPPPIDRSRRYGQWGGLRPPLALHQTDLERQMPRNPDGTVARTADPRLGGWFVLANDGGPRADPTRSLNCLDCTLSLFDTWVHGRPRVSAPRTFDGYLRGDIRRPIMGEKAGPRRVEEVTGGRFQSLAPPRKGAQRKPTSLGNAVDRGFRSLHDQLKIGGHGSYAFLITEWENGGSHAWVALNQNGTVLYLDPQRGAVHDRPLYTHSGTSRKDSVVAIDALVLGRDGRPMPLGGLARGRWSALPDLPDHPPAPDDQDGYGDPYLNRMHLLDGPGADVPSADPAGEPIPSPEAESAPQASPPENEQDELRRTRDRALAERLSGGRAVADVLASSADLDAVFTAGVTPAEVATELDAPTLRRLVPHLDGPAADDVVRLFGDPRVVRMLDETWEAPPSGEAMLGETLVRQLVQRPGLVRMILATPELANSLTARPMTLHHLASHQQAIDVLGSVLDDVTERGAAAIAEGVESSPAPTPLSEEQRRLSATFDVGERRATQPGFDLERRTDAEYRRRYLDQLYVEAAVAQRELDAMGKRLADRARCGAKAEGRPAPKDRQRAEDKVAKYGGDVSRLKDLAAAKIAFRDLSDLYAAFGELRDDSQVEIVEFEDRFIQPQSSGYRDVQMMLRTSRGHIAEFRLHLQALDEVAEWEHSLFELRRDLQAVARQERRSLSEAELAIWNGVLQQERQYFWEALRSAVERGMD